MNDPAGVVELVNPLPGALAHYEAAVRHTLESGGIRVVTLPTTSAERHGTDRGAVGVLLACLRDRLLSAGPPRGTHRLVLWPVLGYPELTLWRGGGPRTTVVVHDPTPLRRQVGLGDAAVRATRVAAHARRAHPVLVHSPTARDEVLRRGFDAGLVPLPILPVASPRPSDSSRRVLVLGQHKDTRDLDLLAGLGELLAGRGWEPHIVGRGWPEVAGWDVDARFVSDEEFESQLRAAAVVLLPYTLVYQSDVAVRAAEVGVPVVAASTSNAPDLYGSDWTGLVTTTTARPAAVEDWAAAIERAGDAGHEEVRRRVTAYAARAEAEWTSWARSL